jgi:hypothetical protein
MSLTTRTVSIATHLVLGVPLPGGLVSFELTRPDVDAAGIVVPQPVDLVLDAQGAGALALWPNARGTQGSQYRVVIRSATGELQLSELATVPDVDCNLAGILALVPPTSVDDAEAAAVRAQAAAAAAAAATASGFVAGVVGPTEPTPSGEYVWFKTDGAGTLLDILAGKNP